MDEVFCLAKETTSRIITTANLILPFALQLDGRGRCGGMLVVMYQERLVLLVKIVAPQQSLTPEQRAMYTPHFALEKTFRLLHLGGMRSRVTGHDRELGFYAGAIRHGPWINSFSGLDEMIDEAFCLAHQCLMGWLPVNDARLMLVQDGVRNPAFEQLLAEPKIAAALAV